MTRINTNPVSELYDEHLIAEYRELPRVFTMVAAAVERGETPATYGIPREFRLGSGHMKFFSDKLGWLRDRYAALVAEMRERGFTVNFPEPKIPPGIPGEWFGTWEATWEDVWASRARIAERVNASSKTFHYAGEVV